MNSYTLKQLDGTPIPGQFSARRLRAFIPKDGTKLAEEQAELEQLHDDEDKPVPDEALEGADEEDQHKEELGKSQGDEDAAIQEGGDKGPLLQSYHVIHHVTQRR